jgi:site-specific recombinase XerD
MYTLIGGGGVADNYFQERDELNYRQFQHVLAGLPLFCEDFFLGIKQQTSMLTRLNYAHDLKTFFRFLLSLREFRGKTADTLTVGDLNAVTAMHLEKYLDYLSSYESDGRKHRCNERAKARKLASVKTFFRYFFNKDKLTANQAAKVQAPKLHDKEIVRLETDEVVNLLNTVENGSELTGAQRAFHDKTKMRDLALLTLLLGTGIRISECVGLNVGDIDFKINGFRITRKGGAQVILYFSDEVAACLKGYLEERASDPDVNVRREKACFLSLQKRRISVRAVQDLVKKYARIIAPLKRITPHKLRSTYGTALYRETHDIYVVADVLGHKDVNTTKKHYAALSDDIRRSAAGKVKLRDD